MADILSWESHFGARTLHEHVARHPSSVGDRTPPAPGVSLAQKTVARVSGGFWIADCPTDGCEGAELVSFEAPFFFCCECRNAAFDHKVVQVVVPAAKKRAEIEACLTVRPVSATRNWLPTETVASLRAENLAHNVTEREA